MVIAFVDESQPGGTAPGRHYVLAATVPSEDADLERYRALLLDAKPQHLSKLHWHEASQKHRLAMAALSSEFDVFSWVVVTRPVPGDAPERARRRCFRGRHRARPTEPMLWVSDAVAVAVGDSLQGRPQLLELLSTWTWVSSDG